MDRGASSPHASRDPGVVGLASGASAEGGHPARDGLAGAQEAEKELRAGSARTGRRRPQRTAAEALSASGALRMLIVEDDRKATRILAKGLDQEESAVHVGRTGEER